MSEDNTSNYRQELYTEEARRDRFIRIAERRTNRVLEDLRLLGNTSNKTLYLYNEKDIEKIFATIEARFGEIRSKFKTGRKEDKFKLDA